MCLRVRVLRICVIVLVFISVVLASSSVCFGVFVFLCLFVWYKCPKVSLLVPQINSLPGGVPLLHVPVVYMRIARCFFMVPVVSSTCPFRCFARKRLPHFFFYRGAPFHAGGRIQEQAIPSPAQNPLVACGELVARGTRGILCATRKQNRFTSHMCDQMEFNCAVPLSNSDSPVAR